MSGSLATAKRPGSKDGAKEIWSGLLDSVSSGRRLPEKTVLVVGGSPDLQRDFLDTLDSEAIRKPQERNRRKAPVANDFAMGFTYQDVLDADHEDTLARLSIYTLPEPPDAYMPLVKPLLTAKTVVDTLLVILLDWAEPWNWIEQLRDRLRLVQQILSQLDNETKQAMEEIMQEWQQRRRGPVVDGASQAPNEPNVNVPLGPGEWDEALGLPLCVVCHDIEKMDVLEKEHSWREEDFDYVQQFVRTIVLKHGGSVIYTASSSPNSLPTLIQSTLGIQSLLKRNPLKHEVVDRVKILIPPNWDTWGKIKVIKEGFDVEGLSNGWGLEVQAPRAGHVDSEENVIKQTEDNDNENTKIPSHIYAEAVRDPHLDRQLTALDTVDDKADAQIPSMQEFLAAQQPVLEQLKIEDEAAAKDDSKSSAAESNGYADGAGRVNEHIGPVQFNMGGIQVDAEDALQRLRKGQKETPEIDPLRTKSTEGSSGSATPDRQQTEHLANFFAGLVKRGTSASPRPPPT